MNSTTASTSSQGAPSAKREAMSERERVLAAIHGKPVDRFPVWLKMANQTWKSQQPEPYRSMDNEALLTACGCDRVMWCGAPVTREYDRVSVTTTREGNKVTTTWATPRGSLQEVKAYDEGSCSWHPLRYPIKDEDDLPAALWLFTDGGWRIDEEKLPAARAQRDDYRAREVATLSSVGPGPLMRLVEELAGPEGATFLLADDPDGVAELFEAMHADHLQRIDAVLDAAPGDSLWLTENTSTTLISPDWFRDYCMPHLRDYGNRILERGLAPVHHMCGTLNALLEMIDELPALANEAYTTRPLGDVSLAEGRRRMPSKCLIGGTNATLWMKPAETIIAEVEKDLAECPDRNKIFLTSAGVLPPVADFEKARTVVAALKEL